MSVLILLCALFVLMTYLTSDGAYKVGKMKGEAEGYGHTSHARKVHMHDLANLNYLIVNGKDVEACEYIRAALSAIECNPAADQKLPEDLSSR